MSLQYAVSRRSVGSHCTPGGVTPPLGINDWGVIQPGESLIPLTPYGRKIRREFNFADWSTIPVGGF